MRGFVTIAVGDEKYYRLAVNLLKSYKQNAGEKFPFAIIADRQNNFTDQFDKVTLLEKPTYSYMDKLEMLNNPPFEENIYIDADCLVYGDINKYWEYFPEEGTTCFGKALPLSSHDGWFEIDDVGDYKKRINFIPQMHGGIIFFGDDELTKNIYSLAITIAENYSKYRFKYFNNPAEEPVLALSMAVNNSEPIELPEQEREKAFLFYPTAKKVDMDIRCRKLNYLSSNDEWHENVLMLHWQNINTETPLYKIEVRKLDKKPTAFEIIVWKQWYNISYFVKRDFNRIKNGLLRRIHKRVE